ncbi:hypothetical protein [Pseudomonas nitroreducens]|nr:hypothetical protein [Pseudomonas nitroreducens]
MFDIYERMAEEVEGLIFVIHHQMPVMLAATWLSPHTSPELPYDIIAQA